MQQKGLAAWAKRHPFALFALLWAGVCSAVCLIGYAPFWQQGRGFIWSADGRNQMYPFLLYHARWLREGMPAYSFSVGLGSDAMTGFSNAFYTPFEPLSVLGALLTNVLDGEWVYLGLILLRLYLAGLAFGAFCFYRKLPLPGVLAGASVYVFCGFAIKMGDQCQGYLVPMLYLPLMLVGFDLILRGGRPLLFLAVMVYAALSGFYFLYMCSFALALYGLIAGLAIHGKDLRAWLRGCVRGVFWYGVGIGLAAPVFIPMVTAYLNSSRSGQAALTEIPLFYRGEALTQQLAGFAAGPFGYERLGLCAVALAALAALMVRRGEWPLKIAAAVTVVLVLMPAAGYVMNGFGYVNTRWTFMAGFLMAWLTAAMWPRLTAPQWPELLLLAAAALGYAVLYGRDGSALWLLAAAAALCTGAAMLGSRRLGPWLLCAVVALNAGGNLLAENAAWGDNYAAEFLPMGNWAERQSTPYASFETLRGDAGFYRVDMPSLLRYKKNIAWVEGWHSTADYISVVERRYAQTMMGWEISPDIENHYDFCGLDGRPILQTVCGVKYLVLPDGDTPPAGFTPVETQGGYQLLCNDYALPFGTVYYDYYTAAEAREYSPVVQQAMLLHSAALEQDAPALNHRLPDCDIRYLSPEITMENVAWEPPTLHAEQDGGCIILTGRLESEGELFLRLGNFRTGEYIAVLTVSGNGAEKSMKYYNSAHPEYYVTGGCTVSLGNAPAGEYTVTVQLSPGWHYTDSIELWQLPREEYLAAARAAAQRGGMRDVTVGKDRITGTATLDAAGQMVFQVPYSSGWTVRIDGQKTAAQCANGMFLSVPVGPGAHTLELTYRTPGLRAGLALFCAALAAAVLAFLWRRGAFGRAPAGRP